jgi:hypothetical protein
MRIRYFLILMLIGVLVSSVHPQPALADGDCPFYDPATGQFTTCQGGGDDDGGGSGGDPGGGSCTPGSTFDRYFYEPAGNGLCLRRWVTIQCDTGGVIAAGGDLHPSACPATIPTEFPCDQFSITGGGVTCNSKWQVCASVGFPVTYLDLRPYPATLVRWPSAVRNGGQTIGNGTGTLDYVNYGGGSASNPADGDWRNLRLTLELRPAGPLYFSMPQAILGSGDHPLSMNEAPFGVMQLTPQSDIGNPETIHWEVPSHPDVGGGPLAGTIAGLDELPADIPLFVGRAYSPYKLFWTLVWEEYTVWDEDICVTGPTASGQYECKTNSSYVYNDGHYEPEEHREWVGSSKGGEITPSMVAGLPANLIAPGEAYWNYNVTIRRMNENNRVDDPVWARSWNWGGAVYWAVREGQGQIGWPGVP